MFGRPARNLIAFAALAACGRSGAEAPPRDQPARREPSATRSAGGTPHVRITTLSTMMTDWPRTAVAPRGEWGYAALVEVDDQKILFDTGRDPEVILHNLAALGISLAEVDHVVLSHHHGDHTGGLVALVKGQPRALSHVHVARGFVERAGPLAAQLGAALEVADRPTALLGRPDVMLTGPIARRFEERAVPPGDLRVPDDQALVIDSADGLLVITGCGHAGIVNTLDAAQRLFPGRPLLAVIGGMHLFERTRSFGVGTTLPDYLEVVAARLRGETVHRAQPAVPARSPGYILGSHCTGLAALELLRKTVVADDPRRAMVDTPGTRFLVGADYYQEAARRRPLFEHERLVDGINPVLLNRPIDWPAPE
jgi:7,8-dihydropterin-6-yl-methyl-4-(beta-D-ribofuranosyl)aminobenzene 5'-phosphate synthase